MTDKVARTRPESFFSDRFNVTPGLMERLLGSNLAGQLTGNYDRSHLESLPALFLSIFWYGVIAGAVMLALTPLLKRLMSGVK